MNEPVSPRVRQAIEQFRGTVDRLGATVEIRSGDKSVTIEPRTRVPVADGQVAADHNELPLDVPKDFDPSRSNVGRLKGFIERVEKLNEERDAIGADIRDVYSEAKGVGYDVKTIRALIRLRKMNAADRDEQEALLDVYKHALGMV